MSLLPGRQSNFSWSDSDVISMCRDGEPVNQTTRLTSGFSRVEIPQVIRDDLRKLQVNPYTHPHLRTSTTLHQNSHKNAPEQQTGSSMDCSGSTVKRYLKDDNGNVVGHKDSTHPEGQPRIDWTNQQAVDWWVSVPLAGQGAGDIIDGVLADGAGFEAIPNITEARLETLYEGKLAMLSRLQAAFDKVPPARTPERCTAHGSSQEAASSQIGRGGVVFGNGLDEYDQVSTPSPRFAEDRSPTDPHNKRILTAVQGIQNEHYAAFEQVDRQTGKLVLDKASDALDNIEWAANSNSSKQAAAPTPFHLATLQHCPTGRLATPFPAPISQPPGAQVVPTCSCIACQYHSKGLPSPSCGASIMFPQQLQQYIAPTPRTQPCGKNSPQGPNCTSTQLYEGWQAELTKYLPFNLASFLSVAQPNTWFTQAVWYEDRQGFAPCPDAPGTCALDPSFYADYLKKPLGTPQGMRQKVAPYKWVREFEHATVT
eukprot:gene6984-1248_t